MFVSIKPIHVSVFFSRPSSGGPPLCFVPLMAILIQGTTAPSATLSPDLQDILKDVSYASKCSSSLPVEMGAFCLVKH